jgi:uncharacterized protein YukE
MTDVTALTALLGDYADALDLHVGTVREAFADLERAWGGLSEVYEGAAAEQFRNVFHGTAARMHQHEHDASALLGVLRQRVGTLERLDGAE